MLFFPKLIILPVSKGYIDINNSIPNDVFINSLFVHIRRLR